MRYRLPIAIVGCVLIGLPVWLIAGSGASASAWPADAVCGPVARAALPPALEFFTNFGSYMPRTSCMVTQTGETDWAWVWLLLFFNAVVIVGYMRIFWFWRRAYLAESEQDRNKKLMDLAWMFLLCAVCGYVSSIVLFFWPAYRLLVIMLIPLMFFTWRFGWNLEPFKVALSARRYQRELRESLMRRNEELELRVAEATEELQHAVTLANRANLAKSQFLANMSHEIRSPMTSIIGYTEIVESEGEIDPDSRKHIEIINRNSRHLLGVINDILDHSKIEAGCLKIEQAACDPAKIIEEVVSAVAPLAAANGNTVVFEVDSSVPRQIVSDQTRLKQIVMNLASNANKFTKGGRVEIAASVESGRLLVSVRDTGVGMTPEQVRKCFDPFVQGDDSTTRLFGGTGLGLSIVQDLSRAMGGGIEVVSEPGVGSTFTVSVQCQSGVAERAGARAGGGRGVDQPAPGLAGLSVLLVEDSSDNRRLIGHRLMDAGVAVSEAVNGQEAVDLLLASGAPCFDLILMDVQMPVLGGIDAVRRVRAGGVATPIIALTANVMRATRAEALEAGCDACLFKPIDFVLLFAAIARHTGRSGRRAA